MLFGMKKERKEQGTCKESCMLYKMKGANCAPWDKKHARNCACFTKMKGQPVVAWYVAKLVSAPLF